MCAHQQTQSVYSRPGPLDFESLPSWRALFVAGYGRLTGRLTTTADDDWSLQIYGSAAYSFCTLLSVWEHVWMQCVCTCMSEADDVNRQEWQRFSSLDALFRQSRSSWDPSTVGRTACALYAFMCYSSYHPTTLDCTAGPANGLREGAEWLHSVCRSMPSLLILQTCSHAWTKCFNLAHSKWPHCMPLAATGFSRMNQAPVQNDTSGVINRIEGGRSVFWSYFLTPAQWGRGLLNR